MKTKEIVIVLANRVCEQINSYPKNRIESNTEYKRQEILEHLIEELKERV